MIQQIEHLCAELKMHALVNRNLFEDRHIQIHGARRGAFRVIAGSQPGILASNCVDYSSGTIGTSAGSVTRKVGIALNRTDLLITNNW